ncbi:MAG: hypothetical protein ACM3UY_03925 [Methanocella sp.]|jgi:uncharacterized membrane protein
MTEKKKVIPLLLVLIVISVALLTLILVSATSPSATPSPFLIAATIVSTVALCGALFSLYLEKKTKSHSKPAYATNRLLFALS